MLYEELYSASSIRTPIFSTALLSYRSPATKDVPTGGRRNSIVARNDFSEIALTREPNSPAFVIRM